MKKISKITFVLLFFISVFFPFFNRAEAVNVFGGQASQVIYCYNDVIWAKVGPPRGGKYIWSPAVTRTYEYGPPSHAGQWLLGLFGSPYVCVVTRFPYILFPGNFMTMLGSSR